MGPTHGDLSHGPGPARALPRAWPQMQEPLKPMQEPLWYTMVCQVLSARAFLGMSCAQLLGGPPATGQTPSYWADPQLLGRPPAWAMHRQERAQLLLKKKAECAAASCMQWASSTTPPGHRNPPKPLGPSPGPRPATKSASALGHGPAHAGPWSRPAWGRRWAMVPASVGGSRALFLTEVSVVTLRCKQYPWIQWNTTVLQNTSRHAPWGIHHGPWAICGPQPCALAQESPRPWPRPEPCVDGYPIGVYGTTSYYVAFHSLVQGAKEGSN